MERNMVQELNEMLEKSGGLYTFGDIMDHIHSGKMQSFSVGRTWLVTQVLEFPRKKVLDIVFIIGDGEDLPELEVQLLSYQKKVGADILSATGRLGWNRKTLPGWQPVSTNFIKV